MSPVSHGPSPSAADARTRRASLVEALKAAVGGPHVLTGDEATRRYRTGFRFGTGRVAAVARPATLVEQWRVLQACVAANAIVIAQASNTGLTGGSTPDGDDYDRDVVIVSTSRIRRVHLIDGGRQVVCLPGATLDQLEKTLKPIGREPHSVIGSSCIGASVIGGICNNSGGSLVRRGPAYTEMAVYAQVDAQRRLSLVNHLGIELGGTPEDVLARLDRGDLPEHAIRHDAGAASDHRYAEHVRDIDAGTPARYNADPLRLHEASGSAGKVMVFAVRLDTFPIEAGAKVFYIGTNRTDELTAIRRDILGRFSKLPVAGEYLHRDAFDVAEKYGKDMFLLIEHLGTQRLPALFSFKSRCDAFFDRLGFLPSSFTDRVMQAASRLFPGHLPARLKEYRDRYEHHLMLKVSADMVDEARDYLRGYFDNATGDFFECTDDEGRKAFLHRFAAAGAAVRYRAVHPHEVENIVALDIALRRNDRDWFETLPEAVERPIAIKLYYGHFLCHVFHQDYIVRKGNDCLALEHEMWKLLDRRGAEYPAEHNVGHLYHAKPELKSFYAGLDPCNCFNPGIGHTSKFANYREREGQSEG
ncbi:D-lactate dehydrogenase [Paraburkholderia caballeronis]|uniref:Quinone-dependent D-lactate dehydrogenase n=1 Tax=Paraburkholderia caballeronis TaxID=416943 RepID=A0A1H7SAU5_9BURK|nr:D-lactate dehydrogenase [Paraburkholderia caballeronis]PXW22979.1 D-lactate dehydrogenase [Paraburkholderia caballeronis]PXW97364.1 D-lactate dehydrogenase [Paraburkholderia caballeronis]RAJ93884.1 D-lactate dehydrogenase [Paraburkholderia caballeronis]SED53772.1 D-lactate dehydrogenase [Paraburkholderia caballeronis]SEL69419.1 D-lactate dehydrogenase [Paraburkholderia caballeronis]